jgi:hypothetical protein
MQLCSSDRFLFGIMASSELNLSQLRQLTDLYKKALQDHYTPLVKELNVHSIVNELFQRKVISFELKQAIQKADICISAATMFLDDLFGRCTAERFENFFELLKTDDSESAISHKKLAENVYTDELVAKAKFIANLEESTDSTKEAEHVLADLQPPLTGDSEDVFFNEDNVPSESQQPDSEHSTKASVEVVQYIYPGNSGDDEASDDTFDMSKQEDTEHLLMEPPASTPKGSPHRPIRQGLELDGSMLRIVCRSCWFNLQLFEKRVRPRGTCKIKEHKKVMVTIDHYHGRLVELRPKPASSRTPAVLCKYSWTKCYQYPDCSFAHGILELEYWNGNIDPEKERCLDCLWKHCNTLVNIQCFRECEHPGKHHVIVYKDVHEKSLLRIHYPRNVASMTNKVYRCKHRFLECTAPDRDACSFPHNNVEEQLWNAWKETYYKPGIKVHHLNIESQMKELVGFFKELKSCCVPASMKVFDQPDSGKNNVLATQMLNHHEQANEYKKKFIKLIEAERLVHEGVLKRCNKKCTLTWYKWKDIWSDHNWYLAMIIEQYIADNVRQAATCVILKYQHMSFKADILIPQRFTHEGEPCLILGFEASDTVASPRFSSFYFLSNELMKQNGRLEVDAEFQLKHSYFNNLRKAVSNLPSCVVDRLVDAPSMLSTSTPRKRTLHISPNQCDLPEQFTLDPEYQLPAFEKLLSCPNEKPFVITGPFGTGKTRVIAAAALWLLMNEKESRILIATHHNRTADEYVENYFTEKVMNNAAMKGVRIIRLLADRAVWKFERLRKKFWMLNKGELLHCRLIVTTFITSMKIGSEGNFTHIFVDEGAQAREPECVAAFHCATPQTKIIIAGDHCQVGPNTSVLGEEVRKQGLAVSLLERLHNSYQKANLDSFQAELLTNHRCDSAILRLPSTLFYNCNVKSSVLDQPHPDWKYPLQFVITSLEMGEECKWTSDKALQKSAEAEVETVKDLVQQCVDNWPAEWGVKKLSLICVMTRTKFAERLWKKTVKDSCLSEITVAVTYDIQGLEYRAVFLCTSEPVNNDFSPFDPVKSICDLHVFNTIITRSRSLVIVVGNPFRLMEIEKKMPKADKKCWLSYIQRCWESDTLALSTGLNSSRTSYTQDALNSLADCMYSEKLSMLKKIHHLLQISTSPKDMIIGRYDVTHDETLPRQSIDEIRKLRIFLGWKYYSDGQTCIVVPSISRNVPKHQQREEYFLKEISPECCLALPLSPCGSLEVISSRHNRRGALDSAMVYLDKNVDNNCQLQVVALKKQGDTSPLICRVDPSDPNVFVPVKATSPRIHSLAVSRDVPKGSVSDLVKRSNTSDSSFNQCVLCYLPESLKSSPRITHSIPIEVARDLLFVVQILSWHVDEPLPCGAAVAILPRASSLKMATNLILARCGIEGGDTLTPLLLKDTTSYQTDKIQQNCAIAIVQNDGTSTFAFSVEAVHDHFLLKIHFVNVIDSLSASISTDNVSTWHTVVGKCHGVNCCHPVISEKSRSSLCFAKSNLQNTITLEYVITFQEMTDLAVNRKDLQQSSALQIEFKQFTTPVVHCEGVFNMSDVDDFVTVLSNGPALQKVISNDLNVFDKFTILYIVANQLHRNRVGHNRYNLPDMTETDYPEAMKVLNEFSIQANHEAALVLKNSFADRVLLKRHNLYKCGERITDTIPNNLQVVPPIEVAIPTLDFCSTDPKVPPRDLHIEKSLLSGIIVALTGSHILGLRQALYKLQYTVHLTVSKERYYALEELYVADLHAKDNVARNVVQDDAHNANLCTSFTSPFQCIADLYVQEGLLAALRGTEWKRNTAELKRVANLCNRASAKAIACNVAMSDLELALSAQQSSVCVKAHVVRADNGILKLCFLQSYLLGKASPHVIDVIVRQKGFKYVVRTMPAEGLLSLPNWIPAEGQDLSTISYGFSISKESDSLVPTSLKPQKETCIQLSGRLLKSIFECLEDNSHCLNVVKELDKLLHDSESVAHEKKDENIVFATLQASFPIHSYQVVKLWLGCDPTTYVPTVRPQCMELAPDVRVCLQHMQDPLTCFTQHPIERASKLLYNSIDDYRALWKNAVLAVSAELTMNNCTNSLVYKNVVLKFSKFIIPPQILTQEMYMPVGKIMATLKEGHYLADSEHFSVRKGDLICARYEVDLSTLKLKEKYQAYICHTSGCFARLVLHLIVIKVVRKNQDMEVFFEVTGTQPSVSPLMKEILQKNQFPCEVEVITMDHILRSSYQFLTADDFKEGDWTPIIIKSCFKDFVNLSIDADSKSSPELSMILGDLPVEQCALIRSGLKNRFQLIHTPSGTGGEVIANALVCSFALLNKEQRSREHPKRQSQQKCVLYCFPNEEMAHQTASSLYKFLLVTNFHGNSLQILHITRKSEHHIPYNDDCVLLGGKCPTVCPITEECKQLSLSHLIRTDSSHAKKLNELEKTFSEKHSLNCLLQFSAVQEYNELVGKAEEEIMSRGFDIIICTASEASSERIRRYFQPVQVVVYNASMITEPETFSAIHQALHVILIGNHHQHPPLLNSDVSAQNGMNVSLFERLYKVIEDAYNGEVATCPLLSTLK